VKAFSASSVAAPNPVEALIQGLFKDAKHPSLAGRLRHGLLRTVIA
jgi:hypothetical protein